MIRNIKDFGATLTETSWVTSNHLLQFDITFSMLQGTRGLSMFYLETRQPGCSQLNNIQIVKLKDKLGTRQLPTAELLLSGTKAQLVGESGRGIACISDMLTISRMYNSLFASSATRR